MSEPHDPVDVMVLAARADRPRAGAKGRALAAVLPELRVAEGADAVPVRPARARRSWVLASAGGAMLVLALVGGGLVLRAHDRQEAARAHIEAQARAQQAELDLLLAELGRQREEVAALQAEVVAAKDASSRAEAEARLLEASRDAAKTASRLAGSRPAAGAGAGARKARAACACTPGDPLCSCVP